MEIFGDLVLRSGRLDSPHPTPPALQNDIIVGWLLLMFAIIPNEANIPPRSWRKFSREREETKNGFSSRITTTD